MIITRDYIFIVCALFVALSGALALFSISSQYRETSRLRNYMEASRVEERLSGVFAAMNDFPGSAGKDMLFLRTLSSVSDLYENFRAETWRRTHADIQQFIDRNIAYDEVHLHAPICMFTARRVSEERGDTSCSSHNPTVDDAVTHTLALSQGSVYISPLVAYTRTVLDKKSTIPAIFYGTRVSAPGNTGDGVAIAVVNANYFLEEIRRLKRPGEAVYLVHTDGSYIAHPESEKEVIAGGTANFYEDFPAVPAGTLSDEFVQTFDTGAFTFTLKRITSTASNFALYDGADQGKSTGYWVLVAVSEKQVVGNWFFSLPYLVTMGIVGIAHVLVIVLLLVISAKSNQNG